jgi:hypothetical protein
MRARHAAVDRFEITEQLLIVQPVVAVRAQSGLGMSCSWSCGGICDSFSIPETLPGEGCWMGVWWTF